MVDVQTPPRKRRKTPLPSEAEAELVDVEAAVVEVQTSTRKRRKTTMPSEVKSWFLEYAALQKKRCNWDMVRTLNQARLLAPELFNGIHSDTPRRWIDAKKNNLKSMRRPSEVTPAMITVLSEVADRVTGLSSRWQCNRCSRFSWRCLA